MQGTLFSKTISLSHFCKRGLYGVCDNRRPFSGRLIISGATSGKKNMSGSASGKKTTRWHRWQADETQVLIAAKKQQEVVQQTEGGERDSKSLKKNWEEIERFCQENGVRRTAQQCRDRWERLMLTYSQIKNWEGKKDPGEASFWSMKADERRANGFLLSLDQDTYNALDELESCKPPTSITECHSVNNDGMVSPNNDTHTCTTDSEESRSHYAVDHVDITENSEIHLSDDNNKVNVMEVKVDEFVATSHSVGVNSFSKTESSNSLRVTDITCHNVVETLNDNSIDINGRETMVSDFDKRSSNPPDGHEMFSNNKLSQMKSEHQKDSSVEWTARFSKIINANEDNDKIQVVALNDCQGTDSSDKQDAHSALQSETVLDRKETIKVGIKKKGEILLEHFNKNNSESSTRGQEVMKECSDQNASFTAKSESIHDHHTLTHIGSKSNDGDKAEFSRKKSSNDDDVFVYIQSTISDAMKFVSLSIKKLLKF